MHCFGTQNEQQTQQNSSPVAQLISNVSFVTTSRLSVRLQIPEAIAFLDELNKKTSKIKDENKKQTKLAQI